MNEYLFSYGTLQKEKVQFALFGRLLTGARDVLTGYKISRIEITDETFLSKGEQKDQLTIAPSDDREVNVEGMVFEVTGNEILVADRYEPANYERIKVRLESGKQAWIYLVKTD